MKTTLMLLIGLAVAVGGRAQTYVNYQLTHFTAVTGGYSASTNIVVSQNTLAEILNLQGTANLTGIEFDVRYGSNPLITLVNPTQEQIQNVPVLGPATVTITVMASTPNSAFAGMLVKLQAVNTTPNLDGFAVQPNGHSATVALQKSSDLVNWTTITNGTYAMTNKAEFYRLGFTVN